MEKQSPTSSVPNIDHRHHHPSSPFSLLCHQSDDPCYPSSQPEDNNTLEMFGTGGEEEEEEEEAGNALQASNTSCWGMRENSGGNQGFQSSSGRSSDREASVGGHFDGDSGLSSHFEDSWFGNGKSQVWVDGFDNKDGSYSCVSKNGFRQKIMNASSSCISYCTNADYYQSDSHVSGYGSRFGEDQFQSADLDGSWFRSSVHEQNDWRGTGNSTGCLPQKWSTGKSYNQKLDSFSDAFLSQRKRGCLMIPSGNPNWESSETPGEVRSSDSYPPPSLSSPVLPSLQSFPSTPTLSHPVPSVLSPPPTPLPPPSYSPSKMDSPVASPGKESHGTQFFTPHLQSTQMVHSSGTMWRFPQFGQESCSLRASHGQDYGSITAARDNLEYPEPSNCSSPLSQSGALWPPSSPSLLPSYHIHTQSPQASSKPCNTVPMLALHQGSHRVGKNPADLTQPQLQHGTSFPSLLHSSKGQRSCHFTPLPLLNPRRKGAGLFSSISSLHQREDQTTEEQECTVPPHINVGSDFQADLPAFVDVSTCSEVRSPGGEASQEHVLWKPWEELEANPNVQQQVEKLLAMCSSSCLPGGGSNTELALHCLHYCQGNTMATLDMLLFSQPSPAGDYHYSGCDFWTDPEKKLFSAALRAFGKEFSFIQKMVQTKTVSQCVEFYYLSQKLQEKQKRHEDVEQRQKVTPLCQPVERQYVLEEVVPVPSLAGFFPCKLCGKMFYKIKSRNAHMKIHRQPQESWMDRRAQHQMFPQHLALSHPTNIMQSNNSNADINVQNSVNNGYPNAMDPSTAVLYSYITSPNSHHISSINDSLKKEPSPVFPLHQSCGSYGNQTDPVSLYCSPEGRVGMNQAQDQLNWDPI
ncbi:transcriptional-regulating factor 1-like isoform X2 [Gouania willdenowi]|nr:transcriptional-regulating factor 1-like isoform X2 [Gouania willdenowi]XP_028331090.1 transcriptional-regulating factor 1-like isoform X2 [Gouania willdenowi]